MTRSIAVEMAKRFAAWGEDVMRMWAGSRTYCVP